MSPSALNPYAAPAPRGATVPEPAPLPEGVRRFRFDPERHRATVRARLLRFQAIFLGLIAVVAFGLYRTVEAAAFAAWLFVVVGALVVLTIRVRRMARRSLATYDLLVGPRVMRRTIAGFAPSEVLRPEVRSAFETRWGIWLCCDVPAHAFFVSSAIAGYEELRAMLGAWAAIESSAGWTAWRRARSAGLAPDPRPRSPRRPLPPGASSAPMVQ